MARHSSSRVRTRRTLAGRYAVVLSVLAASLGALLAAAGPATAGSTSLSSPTIATGNATFSAQNLTATGSGVTATTDLQTSVSWLQPASIGSSFDPGLVRQGRTVTASDTYTPNLAGALVINWTLANSSVSWNGIGPIGLGSPTFSATGACTLQAGGPNYTCSMTSDQQNVIDTFPLPNPYVKLALGGTVTITPQGLAALRSTSFAGTAGPGASISLGQSAINDQVTIPCSVAAGSDLSYQLGNFSAKDGIEVDTSMNFEVGAELPGPFVYPEIDIPFASPSIPIDQETSTITMTGNGGAFDFGNVQANNIPPSADAGSGGSYSGNEGSPISFDGSGSSSVCGTPSLVWHYSDGGVAYGAHPQHTFEGPGSYSGELTATDATGLTNTTDFSVDVADLPPVVHAGPNRTSDWGDPVTLNGSAVDPGTNQQPLLTYSWSYGDGTGGGGGPSLTHTYSTPGNYIATLTVCDPENMCGADSTVVTITRRTTSTSYTGDLTTEVTKTGTMFAALVDDHGNLVIGRNVTFSDQGASTPLTQATTDIHGQATVPYAFPFGTVGVHHLVAAFPGDTLYAPSSVTVSYTVTPAPLTVTANNATRAYGLPNLLSATLSGFIGGQTLATSDVTGTASCTSPATPSSDPQTYPINCTVGSLMSSNYAFTTFVPGTLTVTKAPTTLVAVPTKPTPSVVPKTLTMTATLTSNATGLGVAGQTVTFRPAGSQAPSCTGTTNSSGVATCTLKLNVVNSNPPTYTATFAGTIDYIASASTVSARQ